MDRTDTEWVAGLRCRIITTSLFTPLTPCEQKPKAALWTLSAQRSVEPIIKMFSVPASCPVTGDDVRLCRGIRLISWLRYQP